MLAESSVGYYNISYKISSLISFGLVIFSLTLSPLVQEFLIKTDEQSNFQSRLNYFIKINSFIFSFSIPVRDTNIW